MPPKDPKDNVYDGNGWSQYQILVLDTLKDHTLMLKEVMTEINSLKQQNAVIDILNKNWRDNYDKNLATFNNDLTNIRKEITEIDERISPIEDQLMVEEKSTLRMKGMWAVIGSTVVIVINLLIEGIKFYFHK
jgi:hypothetical protein